jgi:hypothetical protein
MKFMTITNHLCNEREIKAIQPLFLKNQIKQELIWESP